MLEKKGGATAPNSGPAHVWSALTDSALLSKKPSETQEREGPAPLHLLVDRQHCRCSRMGLDTCGCVPTVIRFERNGATFIGVRNPPHGFGGSRVREFYGSGTKARDAYQAHLWAELRKLAWTEYDRWGWRQ